MRGKDFIPCRCPVSTGITPACAGKSNKKILDGVRAATFKPLIECLKSIDQDLLKGAVAGAKFSELFFASCKDEELAAYVKTLL